jgi:hypothetical protein
LDLLITDELQEDFRKKLDFAGVEYLTC